MSVDKKTPQAAKRAPITGLTPDAMKVYSHRPRRNYVFPPMTIVEGLARWLDQIGWVIDAPFPDKAIGEDHISGKRPADELPLHRLNIKEPGIVAEFQKNVTYGLTYADLFQETNDAGSLVGFALEGATVSPRARDKTLPQQSVVRVLVDSVRPRMAMDVAMRLWDFFRDRPGFSIYGTRLNQHDGSQVKVRQPDFHVRQTLVMDEPDYVSVGTGGDRSKVSFRLQVTYVRF